MRTIKMRIIYGTRCGETTRIKAPSWPAPSTLRGDRWAVTVSDAGVATLLRRSDDGSYATQSIVEEVSA